MSAGDILLRAEGLAVALSGKTVLDGVTLALPPGALTILVGPNGAGKTTLLRALAGLARPSRGRVLLEGRPLPDWPLARRAGRIAYLPQAGGVAWPIPVRAVAALGRLPHGEDPERLPPEGRAAVEAALAAVALGGLADRRASELSGGERARVLLARALATRAPVLLADEPVAALDPRHQLLVLDRLRRLRGEGTTIVAVMHDLMLAARFADRIVVLDRGAIVAEGPPAEVLTPSCLARVFGLSAKIAMIGQELVMTGSHPLMIDD